MIRRHGSSRRLGAMPSVSLASYKDATTPPRTILMSIIYICNELGCSYTVSQGRVLMYHPLYADGTHEELTSKYDFVEWDCLDDNAIQHADEALAYLTK